MESGVRCFGTFNGKRGMRCAGSGREAKDFASEIRIKVRNGSFNTEEPGRGADLQKFSSFFDTVYLPYSKENKGTWKHDEFRGEVLKDFFSGRSHGEVAPIFFAASKLPANSATGHTRLWRPSSQNQRRLAP